MENGVPARAEAAGIAETAGILEAGTRVGRYEIRRLIGLGSMSAVYEAARSDTGRPVALKVLSTQRAALPEARARFLTEAKLTARVRHPHIVDVIEVGEDGEQSYLAMEMLEGEDLARRLRHSTFLSVAETADILVPVCEAVAAAHASDIVHRDLKPANIFLAIRDEKLHPVVLDFGVANDTAADPAALPGPHLVFGTPYYLSPEQVADHRAASPASDQWALGVILYECLTGTRPYDGDSLEEVFAAIRAAHAPRPTERRSGISPELGQIVMRAMSFDPKARFASVGELAQALRPFRSALGEGRSPRRRAPSSPSIVAEASTQSPFVRTLTPEPDVMDGLWFEPDPAEESSGDVNLALPELPSGAGPEAVPIADAQRLPTPGGRSAFADRWAARWSSFSGSRLLGRDRIAAAAGGAVAGLVLVLLITHGRSAHRAGAHQSPALTSQTGVPGVKEPTPAPEGAAAPETTPAKAPVTAEVPAPATEPSRPKETATTQEPTAAKEPAVAKELTMAKEPAPAKDLTMAKEPVAAKALTGMKRSAPVEELAAATPSAPMKSSVAVKDRPGRDEIAARPAASRSPRPERHGRGAPAPNEAPAAAGAVARDAAERPRARANPEVRMHNGVPLLD